MALWFDSALADVFFLLVACYIALQLYVSFAFTYWKKRGVPYVQPTSVFGNVKDVVMRREHMSVCLQRVYKEEPGQPCVGLYMMREPVLLVRDPDLLRCIFVKDANVFLDRNPPRPRTEDLFTRSLFMLTGRRWRELRIKLTPTFTSGKIKRMFHLVNACGKQLLPSIEPETEKAGSSVVVKDLVARYSTDVIASCAFGVNANALVDPSSEFRVTMKKMFEPGLSQKVAGFVAMIMPTLRRILNLKFIDPSIYPFVRRTFWDVVDHRRRNNEVRDDFVDLLMQIKREGQVRAEDSKEQEEIEQDSANVSKMPRTEKNHDLELDDNDILGQAFIFILAGFETSSSVISYALYELALQPDIQQQLRSELQDVLKKHNNEVTYDAIADMPYLDMVVSETIRKYPTVPVLERVCLQDYKVPGTNITIEKDTRIVIPVRSIHYDPDFYPDPEKFDPERFSAENKRTRPNYVHLPFGEGPRICIGLRFGQMQVKTALVHVITSFQVSPCADTPTPPLRLKPFNIVNIPTQDIVLAFNKLH